MPSFRSELVYRRTYSRPKPSGGSEAWGETINRVIAHQQWLWERAKGAKLELHEETELAELRELLLHRKVAMSGRTTWLGGTKVAQTREASQFNCSFGRVETVYDIVDAFWLLLQGCGVGFEPVTGTLNGFNGEKQIEIIRSQRTIGDGFSANQGNLEFTLMGDHVIMIGDSAEAWAKAVGKLFAWKGAENKLIINLTHIRAAGQRLSGYGWMSQGDAALADALEKLCDILNKRANMLLTRIDIVDVLNLLGTVLSSRRAAEIAVVPSNDAEALDFAVMKKDYWQEKPWRGQSNNSLLFWERPSKMELYGLFQTMLAAGGSEPGFINAQEAKRRAPWFKGVNPCAEILLANRSFCNLVEVNWNAHGQPKDIMRSIWLAARANYRQTCVNLRDGVLSSAWHESNEFLRLCGVGPTGIVPWLARYRNAEDTAAKWMRAFRSQAALSACEMAHELKLPFPKAVTTVKPSGTMSKVMDTTEGVHKPLARYIFNNIVFGKLDPLVEKLRAANYRVVNHPYDKESVVITIPVDNGDLGWRVVNGMEVNNETALDQLERYKMLMDNYVDHNCSITVSYDPEEVPEIVEWLHENWDSYVGVSFILRIDPTKTALDLGYPFLPQEPRTKEAYDEYTSQLLPVTLDDDVSEEMLAVDDCATGACPVR